MRVYVQSYIVQAEPCLDVNGHNGYDVYYPDGRTVWMPVGDFEIHHRVIDTRERMIMDMTSAEQLVMAISDLDGKCAHVPPEGHIAGEPMYCAKCDAPMD